MQVPGVAIEIYKAKKYRKNKKIYLIEAIRLVELASSLHASERLGTRSDVAQKVWQGPKVNKIK